MGIPKQPDVSITRIQANGKTVWETGKLKAVAEGLTFIEETASYIKISCPRGNGFSSLT